MLADLLALMFFFQSKSKIWHLWPKKRTPRQWVNSYSWEGDQIHVPKQYVLYTHILFLLWTFYDHAPRVLSLCSCIWAVPLKRGDWRIPEQECEPNSATRTHWTLQAQASQSLCKYSVLSILNYTGDYIYSLTRCLFLLNITVMMLDSGAKLWSIEHLNSYCTLFSIDLACSLADQKQPKQASNIWWRHCGGSQVTTGKQQGQNILRGCYLLKKYSSVLLWNKISFQR